MGFDPTDAPESEYLKEERQRYQGSEPVPLRVEVKEGQDRELHAPLPIHITPLPRAALLNFSAAQEFLESSLSWGETGLDLVIRIQSASQDQTASSIERGCREVAQANRVSLIRADFEHALHSGVSCGLLITGFSRGYREDYSMRPEDPQRVYRVNENSDVHRVLLESHPEGLPETYKEASQYDRDEAHALLTEEPFFRSALSFRKDLTAIEFYSLFVRPLVEEEVSIHSDFYPDEQIPIAADIQVRRFCEGQLMAAVGTGLLVQVEMQKDIYGFVLSKQGKELLDELSGLA